MIYHDQLNLIRRARRWDDFLHPDYQRFSIAEIGPTILKLFGVKPDRTPLAIDELSLGRAKNSKVIMLLIDGFGYRHLIKSHKNIGFFNRVVHFGNVYPITSVFPSTTPAALTTIHTGMTPQEHGLPEWTVYFEEFDSIIETLPFKTWDMTNTDGLLSVGGSPHMLYEGETVYEQLQKNGVTSYMFIYHKYADTAYSNSVHAGSKIVPFEDGSDLARKFIEIYLSAESPSYFFIYWGNIDSTAHQYGPDTKEHIQSILDFSRLMEDELLNKLTPDQTRDTIFMLTADHGHVNIQGEDIINLNKYPEIDKSLMRSKNGKRILPTGSPHDVFLFIEPDKRDDLIDFLRSELIGRASVFTIEQILEMGLFGINKPSPKFLRRVGNTVILPHTHYHVWYEFFPDIPYHMQGIHGGLAEDEMIVPLTVANFDQIVG